jgi:nitrite reductase (NADH) small subunit
MTDLVAHHAVPDASETCWVCVAQLCDLEPNRGVAARIGTRQVAMFMCRAAGSPDELFAVDNLDPFSGAYVISRGIVGDRSGEWKVASPIYKQQFSLQTGVCFDDPSVVLDRFAIRVSDGLVEIEWPL